jgi:integrase
MSTTPQFASGFAAALRAFVEQKHALGHPYEGSVDILRQFDAMCSARFEGRDDLSQDICLAWALKAPTEGSNALRNRAAVIREFARFLIRRGDKAYVLPPDVTRKGARHVPHIYTREQIATIFALAEATVRMERSPARHLVIPAILRVIYCCGLRPREARTLPASAVDLERGRLNIMESKGHKDRHVWMADDLTEYLRSYDKQVRRLLPDREMFFPARHGGAYTKVWLDKAFRTIRDQAAISAAGDCPPRLYDLRHTFATHRLYQWAAAGRDLDAALPYLSAYMGHAQLSDTFYYIHLVPDIAQPVSDDVFTALLPEVVNTHE